MEPFVWNADPDKPMDIKFTYFGSQNFIPAEVGNLFPCVANLSENNVKVMNTWPDKQCQ